MPSARALSGSVADSYDSFILSYHASTLVTVALHFCGRDTNAAVRNALVASPNVASVPSAVRSAFRAVATVAAGPAGGLAAKMVSAMALLLSLAFLKAATRSAHAAM